MEHPKAIPDSRGMHPWEYNNYNDTRKSQLHVPNYPPTIRKYTVQK